MKIPRSVRNFNYGNIRKSSAQWQGLVGYDPQGFCIFKNDFYGIRALYKQLRTYRLRGWMVSPKEFVRHYCPASDGNDESRYTKFISRAWTEFDLRTKEFAENLAFLIVTIESGLSPYQIDSSFNRDVAGCLHSLAHFYL